MEFKKYDQLIASLKKIESENPTFFSLKSICQSTEGREIPLMEISPKRREEVYPAVWIDANIHSSELIGSAAALNFIEKLAEKAKKNPKEFEEYIGERTLYIAPRISVDGAEYVLNTNSLVRSSPKNYPYEKTTSGIIPTDLLGNGIIQQMRVESPLGEWSVSDLDSRLMVPRKPGDKGPFYFLFREGLLANPKFLEVPTPQGPFGLDFNRNFPRHFSNIGKNTGGIYPLDQPETRALVEFISAHPNIYISLSLHSYGRVILYPPCHKTSLKIIKDEDLNILSKMAHNFADFCGYQAKNTLQDFAYDRGAGEKGTFMDWAYDDRGILSFVAELWSLPEAAGLDNSDPVKFFGRQSDKDDFEVLKFLDKKTKDKFFHSWEAFDHPQLGKVEIGGFDSLNIWNNPPTNLRKKELEIVSPLLFSLIEWLPKIVMEGAVKPMGENQFLAELEITNNGALSTYGTGHYLSLNPRDNLKLEILCDEVEPITDSVREIPHLLGYSGYLSEYGTHMKYSFHNRGPRKASKGWLFKLDDSREPSFNIRMMNPKAGNRLRKLTITEKMQRI